MAWDAERLELDRQPLRQDERELARGVRAEPEPALQSGHGRGVGPKSRRLSTAAASASVSVSASITCMPASAKARPSANPMPLAPPVTKAVLPASCRIVSSCCLSTRRAWRGHFDKVLCGAEIIQKREVHHGGTEDTEKETLGARSAPFFASPRPPCLRHHSFSPAARRQMQLPCSGSPRASVAEGCRIMMTPAPVWTRAPSSADTAIAGS
jgi:hypothetical protein